MRDLATDIMDEAALQQLDNGDYTPYIRKLRKLRTLRHVCKLRSTEAECRNG